MRNKFIRNITASTALAFSLVFAGCSKQPIIEDPISIGVKTDSVILAKAINDLKNPKKRNISLVTIQDWTYESIDLRQIPQLDHNLADIIQNDPEPRTRARAACVLRNIFRDPSSKRKDEFKFVIKALIKAMENDPDKEVRVDAIITLGFYHGSDRDVITALKRIVMTSESWAIREEGLESLSCTGDSEEKQDDALREISRKHQYSEIRRRAKAFLDHTKRHRTELK